MRLRAPLAVLVAAVFLGASNTAADPTGRFFYVTPTVGFTLFDGSLHFNYANASAIPTSSLKDSPYWGARVGYQYRPWLGIELAGGASPTRVNDGVGGDVSFWHVSGDLTLTHYAGLVGNPFISVGWGISHLTPKNQLVSVAVPGAPAGTVHQGNLEAAAGWNYWFTDRIAGRIEGRDIVWLAKDPFGKALTHTITSTVALTYAIGSKPRDTDADGVPDRRDDCPGTPKGATVDARGCTHDSDGDGVLDGLDACPHTPHGCTIDARGCETDSDGDGVCDGLDKCPDTPKGATVDSSGCTHDSDGDGVVDGIDTCPNTPKGARVDEHGCPIDSDHDGVPDGLDLCPDTAPGIAVDSTGCPVGYREREQEFLDTGRIRLENVQFETGKALLRAEALPVLDAVGDLLNKWPDLQIEIGGHTDSKGSKKLNDKLSQARADTVRSYLLRRFPQLKPDQYVAKGYGPSKPIASNDTEAGRALNRRVEFVVLNRGVLMREIERRTKSGAPSDTTKTPEGPGGSNAPPGGVEPKSEAPKPVTLPAPVDTTRAPSGIAPPPAPVAPPADTTHAPSGIAPPDTTKK